MKRVDGIYGCFYIAFFIVVCVAVFLDKWLLIYTKPIVTLSLTIVYITYVEKVNLLFPISMVLITAIDILTYIDFLFYFDIIAVLITVFYIVCVLQLRKFVAKEDIRIKKIISPPAIISIVLVFYLIYSITQLALPRVDNSIASVMLIIIGMLMFSAFSFIIYVGDRYEKSIYLFIAASCTLFVDALLAVNELYYYNRVFTVLINIAEISGIYFFASFFIETKPKNSILKEKKYF